MTLILQHTLVNSPKPTLGFAFLEVLKSLGTGSGGFWKEAAFCLDSEVFESEIRKSKVVKENSTLKLLDLKVLCKREV